MRIGIIAPPWVAVPPRAYGGTEAVIDRLARGFVRRGHDVLLWTTGDSRSPVPTGWVLPRSMPDHMGDAGIELHHATCGYDAMRAWDADIVHDHTILGPSVGARCGVPVVTTNHGPFSEQMIDVYRATAREGVPIVAISADQASRARDVPIAAVIHHGIDVDEVPYGRGEGGYLLFLGRIATDKGIFEAITAAKRAGARLLIAAKCREVGERLLLERTIAPLLDDDIVFLGEVNSDAKQDLLAGAAALLNPIQWDEPFGLVMIEALAAGTPVLCFRRGAAPEIVTDGLTGFVCDDLPTLTARIGELDAIDRRVCRAAAEERFSTDRMLDDHMALFERVARPMLLL
jgi:glycosyltransferase involved in cell wall biosynthesis